MRRYGILTGLTGFTVWDCFTGRDCGTFAAREDAERERVAREDRAAEVRLRGEEHVEALEREASDGLRR